jgi:hypothetical protein
MTVATPAMQRRAIPAQKEAPWGLVGLLTAAAKVDDGVAWLEAEVGKMVAVIATLPDDVDETELKGDDVPSGVEVTYGCCKHVSAYKTMSGLTEMGADICTTIRSYDMNT